MTEQAPEVESITETGVAAVDEVLREVGTLDGRPVSEHVAVLERAHETLRRALDDAARPASRV